jgi:hypothetical protein
MIKDYSLDFPDKVAVTSRVCAQPLDELLRQVSYTYDQMKDAAHNHLLPGWSDGSPSELKEGLDSFLRPFAQGGEGIQEILRSNYSPTDFFDWLYSVDHISLAYGLSYQGTSLENLSPGTKGIVLLMLYLAMDAEDRRPLLIDQPDENLDNESIYSLLAAYFRTAKVRRQILLKPTTFGCDWVKQRRISFRNVRPPKPLVRIAEDIVGSYRGTEDGCARLKARIFT